MLKGAFPPLPEVDLSDVEHYSYPDPIVLPDITPAEVERAIKGMAPKKAPGRDGIPTRTLQELLPQLKP
jgi:hypothetical protein